MASLPTIKRVLRSDLGRDIPLWVDSLLSPINQFMEEIYSAMNRNLSIPENVSGQTITINFKTLSTYTSDKDFTELNFRNSLNKKMTHLMVGNISQIGDPSKKHDSIFLSWYDNNDGTITIRYISGLTDSSEYNITLLGL